MVLSVQIQSFIFSFVFGILFSYVINLAYKYLFLKGLFIKLASSFFVVFSSCMIYFLGMKFINHAILHIYFYFMVVIGYIIGNFFSFKFRKY